MHVFVSVCNLPMPFSRLFEKHDLPMREKSLDQSQVMLLMTWPYLWTSLIHQAPERFYWQAHATLFERLLLVSIITKHVWWLSVLLNRYFRLEFIEFSSGVIFKPRSRLAAKGEGVQNWGRGTVIKPITFKNNAKPPSDPKISSIKPPYMVLLLLKLNSLIRANTNHKKIS